MPAEVLNRARGQHKVVVGSVTMAFLVVLIWLVFTGTLRSWLQGSVTTVTAVFSSTAVLHAGAPVRVNGIDDGQVTGIRMDPGGRSATVTMQVNKSALPLYKNATAAMQWRTVLGGTYFINLDRGSSFAGVDSSDHIAETHTRTQVELDQVLQAFGNSQLKGIQTTLATLPVALADRLAPKQAFSALAAGSGSLTAALKDLRGLDTDVDVRQLVVNAADAVRDLDAPRFGQVISSGAQTFSVTAAHASDLQSTFVDAAAALPGVRTTLARLDTTLSLANPLISRLHPAALALTPTLGQLHPVLVSADSLLSNARPLLRDLSATVPVLKRASEQAVPVLSGIEPSVSRLANSILPALAKTYSGTKRTTYEMIGPSVEALQAIASNVDSISHMVNFAPGGGERAVDTLPCRTYVTDPTAQQLIACESVQTVLQSILDYQPLAGSAK